MNPILLLIGVSNPQIPESFSMNSYNLGNFGVFGLLLGFFFVIKKNRKRRGLQLGYAYQEKNTLLLKQQLKIEEGKQIEKRRISEELHDSVMGQLCAIRLNLDSLNDWNDPETIKKCSDYAANIKEVENEIRSISHNLNQEIFIHSISFDFVSLIKQLIEPLQYHSGIICRLTVDEMIEWQAIEKEVKIQMYRILQEALQNIVKYAQAQNVNIRIKQRRQSIKIKVLDDGVGFVLNPVNKGIGIMNMHNRTKRINGQIEVKSTIGAGTEIEILIPLRKTKRVYES